VALGDNHPTGRALYALMGFALLSWATIGATPVALHFAGRVLLDAGEGQQGLAYLRFLSIQLTPGVAVVSVALCIFTFLSYKLSRLYVLSALWLAVAGWHALLYALAG